MKKLFVFILAMILCIAPITVMAESALPFKDVAESAWYYADVKTAYELKLINGKGAADTYMPDAEMTYAEAIKLAACMHQLHTTGSVTLVNGTANWYDTYVEYCKTNGIIAKDYNFNDKATRSGYMEIFAKALPDAELAAVNSVADNSIPDVKSDAEYAPAVYKLYRAGILAGVDAAHNCSPASNIKRSEVAVILSRMMDKTKRVSFSIEATLKTDVPTEEDKKIYSGNKTAMESLAKSTAETVFAESLTSSYSLQIESTKVIEKDDFFRYIVEIKATNSSITGSEQITARVMIRVNLLGEYEVYKKSAGFNGKNYKNEAKAEFGWGTRPADFGKE